MDKPDRELIGQMNLKGGLKLRNQKVQIFFIKGNLTLPSKVSIKHGIHNGKEFTESPRTLRYDSYGAMLNFRTIFNKALIKIGKDQGVITPGNIEYQIRREKELIEKLYRGKM